MQTKLLIAGKFVAGAGAAEAILDSATGKPIATVHEADAGQLDAAVAAAEQAFAGWSQTVPKDRAAALLAIADRITADAAAYAALESQNTGKPLPAAGPAMMIAVYGSAVGTLLLGIFPSFVLDFAAKAGLKRHLHAHLFRHSAVTHALAANVPGTLTSGP
jgi:hypothetical protein